MKTHLDKLLESIDPKDTLDSNSSRVNHALNSFQFASGMVSNRDEFEDLLKRFFRHTENCILSIPHSRIAPSEMDTGRCGIILRDIYGGFQGEKIAFDIARTGVEGGLYGVLKAIASKMADEYAKRAIASKIACFWGELEANEALAVVDEYLIKFGHLLPPEFTEGNGLRAKMNFERVLKEHPFLIKRMRKIGR